MPQTYAGYRMWLLQNRARLEREHCYSALWYAALVPSKTVFMDDRWTTTLPPRCEDIVRKLYPRVLPAGRREPKDTLRVVGGAIY